MAEARKASNFPEVVPAIGPYSHVVESGGFVFLSGQIPLDSSGNVVSDDIEEQTRAVMDNIGKILNKAGLGLGNVVKTTIFLTNMADFPAVNKVYGEYFKDSYPARSTVGVSQLPKNVKVEIEVICRK